MAYETASLTDTQLNILTIIGDQWRYRQADTWKPEELGSLMTALGMESDVGADLEAMAKAGWFTRIGPAFSMTALAKREYTRIAGL
ncbi:hypothetical protein AncyloWKF20_07430 [Ancylobacter sp. WKF20]|uniref:hypothetical protein n=1 Tax=Ancylobacter sp. WKF20 TaxID=3039801 RepID=UPI0024345CC4|nr:hypothetical protein [Ancylobacter sp. WKF20]WGD31641.1 hypothetical protein AncyloWKF20_07430 [Ancylobacter sp. WKF20]